MDFDIPDIPWELVAEARRKTRKVWMREDLDLRDPALILTWKWPSNDITRAGGNPADRFRNPELDVQYQLNQIRRDIEHIEAGAEAGVGNTSMPGFNLLHFGTGPLATAFGAKLIIRENDQPFFEPAVHTAEEVLALKKPDLNRDGILRQLLERIDYYNEATRGKIPLTPSDTAGPWSIATQIWHYEDMLEAIHTAPEAVHYLLDLVTECIIDFYNIQETRIGRWSGTHVSLPYPWYPSGTGIGDDCMVCVSPSIWEEFFLPYNDRLAREYGGIFYHCCMGYERYFESLTKSYNFIGFDADPAYNSFDKMESVLSAAKGVWTRTLVGDYAGADAGKSLEDSLFYIRRLKGRVGMFLGVHGEDRQGAIDGAKRLLDSI